MRLSKREKRIIKKFYLDLLYSFGYVYNAEKNKVEERKVKEDNDK